MQHENEDGLIRLRLAANPPSPEGKVCLQGRQPVARAPDKSKGHPFYRMALLKKIIPYLRQMVMTSRSRQVVGLPSASSAPSM